MSISRPAAALVAFALLGLTGPAASGAEPDLMLQPKDSIRLISRADDGDPGNGGSGGPSVSRDGNLIAFSSSASDLVGLRDDNGASDVFVFDRRTKETTRVSNALDGGPTDDDSYGAEISADGRYVVFLSRASDIVPIDTDGELQAYLYDRVEETTTLVTHNAAGEAANDDTTQVAIDGDGSLIAYVSDASNLAQDDTNGVADVFLHSVGFGTKLITREPDGDVVDESSNGVDISDDGKVIAIGSYASDLVPADWNGSSDVFTLDRTTDEWTLISRDPQGLSGDGNSYQPVISPDGGFVAFASNADLAEGEDDDNFIEDVYLYNRAKGQLELISLGMDGTAAETESYPEAVSRKARAVTFSTESEDVVPGDDNGTEDVFLRSRGGGITLVTKIEDGSPGENGGSNSAMDRRANIVVFASSSWDFVPDDDNGQDGRLRLPPTLRKDPAPRIPGPAVGDRDLTARAEAAAGGLGPPRSSPPRRCPRAGGSAAGCSLCEFARTGCSSCGRDPIGQARSRSGSGSFAARCRSGRRPRARGGSRGRRRPPPRVVEMQPRDRSGRPGRSSTPGHAEVAQARSTPSRLVRSQSSRSASSSAVTSGRRRLRRQRPRTAARRVRARTPGSRSPRPRLRSASCAPRARSPGLEYVR